MLLWVRSLAEDHDLCFEERAKLQAECAQAGVELAVVFGELSPEIWMRDLLCY